MENNLKKFYQKNFLTKKTSPKNLLGSIFLIQNLKLETQTFENEPILFEILRITDSEILEDKGSRVPLDDNDIIYFKNVDSNKSLKKGNEDFFKRSNHLV